MATKPSLALIPSGYRASNVYSVLPTNGDGDFDFSRAGTATRVNAQGLIETVGANVPRLDYSSGGCPSLLLESERTNLLTYSEDFSQSVWYKYNGFTVENSDEPSPKGDLSAKKLIRGTNDLGLRYTGATTLGTEYTFSLYAKKGTHDTLGLDIGDVKTDFDLTDEWQRFSVTVTPAAYNHIDIELSGSLQGDFIHIFGAQLEQASYASSYIPTLTGITATRYRDFAQIPNGASNIINSFEGSVFYDLSSNFVTTASDYFTIEISTQTSTNNRIQLSTYAGAWRLYLISPSGSVSLTNIGNIVANERVKIALTYSSTGLRASINGGSILVQAGTYIPTTTLDSIKFSNVFGSGTFVQGNIYDTRIYNTALTDQELIELTTI